MLGCFMLAHGLFILNKNFTDLATMEMVRKQSIFPVP